MGSSAPSVRGPAPQRTSRLRAVSPPIDVAAVQSPRDLGAFVDLPWSIYRGHPNWAPPLKSDVRRILDVDAHPFWEFGERELFLARRGDEIVGRIAAIIDHRHNERHQEQAGVFGFFECEDDREAASALFASAEQWLRDRGQKFVRGPYNPSLNYEVGLLVEGHQHPATLMMPYQPPYYQRLIEACGFEKEKDLLAFLLTKSDRPSKRFDKMAERIRRQGLYTVRSADIRRYNEEIALIKELYNSCWEGEWNFVPMTDGEVDEMARNLRRIVDPDLILFFYHGDQPVGICMVLPDMNPMLRRLNGRIGLLGPLKYLWHRREICGLRGLIIGFKPDHLRKGLPLLAFDRLNQILRHSPRYDYLELGWNLEDNRDINNFDAEMGAQQHKRIRIYRKPLVDAGPHA
ncbi:MAG: hypothetical protein RIC55_32820 [Pirellulaceae bacterium]